MLLRDFHISDLDDLLKLEADTFPKTAFSTGTFLRYHLERASRIRVCEDDGRLVGYVVYSVKEKPRRVYVDSIAVRPSYRRRGMGQRMMDEVLNAAREVSAEKVTLHVRTTNRDAVAFYESLGFRTERTIPDYYGTDDAYLMRLELRKDV